MMWAIGVKFLRGVCVATDTGQWDQAEWPPHPARMFMALAATYFENQFSPPIDDASDPKRLCLEWLEQLPPPRIFAASAEVRTPVTVYVPVNDSTKTDQLLPAARSRQPRHFPTSIPAHDDIFYVFDVDLNAGREQALNEIATEVVRIGHSSSLTQVWIENKFDLNATYVKNDTLREWVPETVSAAQNSSKKNSEILEQRLRVVSRGMFASLRTNYNLANVESYVAMQREFNEAKGKTKAELKLKLAEKFPFGMPPTQRPSAALAIKYSVQASAVNHPVHSIFDRQLMVLAFQDSPIISLESTLQLAGAIRKKIHDAYLNRNSPEWLGGHQLSGAPSTNPHMAIVPLPFIDHAHADGHLLGLALVFPRDVSQRDRAVGLRALFERSSDGDWILNLRLHQFHRLTEKGSDCDITLVREERLTPPRALNSATWSRASTVWETVTPISLDRFPKSDRFSDRQAWNYEVAETISGSCVNIGLPKPIAVHTHHNTYILGSLNAGPKGSGFPTMVGREGKASRYQVHARIVFATPVVGPVILGAGRFVGYGFCRPNLRLCKERRGVK